MSKLENIKEEYADSRGFNSWNSFKEKLKGIDPDVIIMLMEKIHFKHTNEVLAESLEEASAKHRKQLIQFLKWINKEGWQEHSSGNYYYKLEFRDQWPPTEMVSENELLEKFTAL